MPGPHAETSACAADCLAVHLQHGESKGSMFETTLPLSGTISTYVACPPGETVDSMKEKKATKVILWACDVYGPKFINNQLLMDWHASNGYLVLSPDYFHGEQLDHFRSNPGFSLPDWISKFKAPVKDEQGKEVERTTLLLREWTKVVKGMFGGEGTRYAVVGAGDEVSAGAIVHPAHLDDDEAFNKLKQPLYASLAEQDRHFGPDRRNTLMAALTRLSTPEAPDGISGEHAGTSGYDYMVQVFSGVMHGFALRGDMKIERNRWAKETSAKACRDWFDRFLT
ncbi:hypothetical protein QFC20_003948 [Naganishia adeliensis]|uniref:Uncharacterized protein n=1 Tax=Naganishia adeliensis TaxID=92952 RepID=A0ACC2W703_9TREE|nr:hypothetical protein QFC20_003948 [Naganishia adeliensis]